MNPNEYQTAISEIFSALSHKQSNEMKRLHWALASGEEVGEVLKECKKHLIFQSQTETETKEKLTEEIGDVILCLSQLAQLYDIELSDILRESLVKMKNRWGHQDNL